MPNDAFCLPGNTSVQEILERQDEGYLPPGHIYGLTLSNNAGDATNDIDIASGCCRSTANAAHSYAQAPSRLPRHQRDLEFPDSVTKQLDVLWAPGNGGGRSASALANSTWHMFAIGGKHMKDRLFFHDSVTESSVLAAMPGGYTAARLIGSVLRESGAIVGFVQDGDYFQRKTLATDVSATNPGTNAVTRTLSVPVGVNLIADLLVSVATNDTTTNCSTLITDLAATDETPSTTLSSTTVLINTSGGTLRGGNQVSVRTNTSGQVRSRVTYTVGAVLTMVSRGWWHPRGKNA